MAKITFEDKVALLENADIPEINKVTDGNINEIKQVVNENDDKFLINGLNVSNEVDEDYRVNFVKSKNLCDGVNQSVFLTSTVNKGQVLSGSTGLYIKVKGGNYTISTTASQTRYRVACMNSEPSDTSQTAYNGVNKDGTSDTITIDTTGYSYLIVNATDLTKIQIEEGSSATTFTAYTPPSIYVDGEEIYSKELLDNATAFMTKVGDRLYTKFKNSGTSQSITITVGNIDRETYLIMGVNNSVGSILSLITSSSSTTNVKNLGTVSLSVSRSGSNITVSNLGTQYTYVLVISYDSFTIA